MVVLKLMQTATARPQLAWSLRTAQEQNTDNGKFRFAELKIGKRRITQTLSVLLNPAPEVLFTVEQMPVFELPRGTLHETRLQ